MSSCGRLQSGGVPLLAVRSAATSNNMGPYGCVGSVMYGCPSSDKAFTTTFKAVADTF